MLVPKSSCPLCNSRGHFSFQGRDLLFNGLETYQYIECTRCGAVYQDPLPSPDKIAGFYPDEYAPYRKPSEPKRHGIAKLAVLRHKYGYTHLRVPCLFLLLAPFLSLFKYRDSIAFIPNGRALDIGCGSGKFMRAMNSLGWQFEGVEFNKVAVDACRKAGLTVFHGELQTAAYDDDSFDLITARHLIEHIPDPNNFVVEVARILKKGGYLVIETPNSQALGRRWFGANWYANDVPRHLILFNPDNLDMLLKKHGLRQVELKTFTTPKIILNSLDYLIHKRDRPSRKSKLFRLLSRPYVMMAAIAGRGDIIFAVYEKL